MTRHARAGRTSPLAVVLVTAALVLACVAGAAVALRPWSSDASAGPTSTASGSPAATPGPSTPTPTPSPTADPDADFTVVAAGDVLPHTPVIASATDRDGDVDFGPLLAPVDPWVQGADLALCHLEVPIAPPGSEPSGYPVFGAPVELAQGLADQGWDGCSTASNHSVDRGFAGVTATLDALDDVGLGHVGTARTELEAQQPQLYTLDRAGQTITVAHIAATYGTNGMPVDADKPWSVTRIDVPAMVAEAEQAREDGADVVIASVHCCVEYQTEPTAEQEAIAQELADSGQIDLYIGHHAHVPQPVALLDGGPDGAGMWVAYGLGNFLSNQDGECCSPKTDSGVLLTAHISSPGAFDAEGRAAGPPRVTGVEWTGLTVDRRGGHRVHALPDIPDGTDTLSPTQVAERLQRVADAVGSQAPERDVPTAPTGSAPTVVSRRTG
ncbi:CapA family protein [Cellulomonas sp. DKR-3]|uniref:CapA family protein n=1 Tax=Cellulomonas fulva TaxID=2835530 RepID=A0ABS5U2Z9_9CELL|nr:CapA family protein [Cellulomonas fulva]MBT0995774.1 CapA family protein [Cellulomonas fulva]